MSNYAVKSGDNLWNICKRAFNLKNTTEIAKKVKEVANANNLKNPQLIFPGQEINLDMGLTVEREQKNSNPSTPVTPVIEKSQAQAAAEERAKKYTTSMDRDELQNTNVSLFGTSDLTDKQKETAYREYSQGLLDKMDDGDGQVSVEEFSNGVKTSILERDMNTLLRMTENDNEQLAIYDKNKDGHITAEEYIQAANDRKNSIIKNVESTPELLKKYDKDNDGKISDEEYTASFGGTGVEEFITKAQRKANIFSQNLDLNQDGKISADEFAFYNKNADGCDGKKDGVIDNGSEIVMFGAVTGMNADNTEYNRVVNKYFKGETLSDAEMAILKESQGAIRKAMNKAAGLNPEK